MTNISIPRGSTTITKYFLTNTLNDRGIIVTLYEITTKGNLGNSLLTNYLITLYIIYGET